MERFTPTITTTTVTIIIKIIGQEKPLSLKDSFKVLIEETLAQVQAAAGELRPHPPERSREVRDREQPHQRGRSLEAAAEAGEAVPVGAAAAAAAGGLLVPPEPRKNNML